MSRTGWKAHERRVARIVGGKRYPANTGGPADAYTEDGVFLFQAKEVARMSLHNLEALAREIERVGFQKSPPALGVVAIKRSAGRGRVTPTLFVCTDSVWREMNGGSPNWRRGEAELDDLVKRVRRA